MIKKIPAKTGKNKSKPTKEIASKNDVLDRDVAVVAALEQNGLHVKAKSRAFAAFDRLLGNIIDYPSALVEPKLNLLRDESRLQQELRSVQHGKIVEHVRSFSPQELYFQRYCAEQMEKDRNKLLVAFSAIEELKRLPAPQTPDQDRSIDADWLNEYAEIAGRKSCEDIQKLWGRLLAGEIRSPGSYNLRILQRLSAIDSDEAKKINQFLVYAVSNQFVFREEANSIAEIKFNAALEMEDLGVLNTGGGSLSTDLDLREGDSYIFVLSGDMIRITAKQPTRVRVPVFPLTAFGKALSELILLEKTPDGYIEKIISSLRTSSITIDTATIMSVDNAGIPKLSDWVFSNITPAASP